MDSLNGKNLLKGIRGINNGIEGKNYGLDDCISILMERIGEIPKLDYWTLTGITGDGITQVYNKNVSTLCEYCVSGYLAGPDYIKDVFDSIGYEHTYITADQINTDKSAALKKLMDYIDKGIPVIVKTNLRDMPAVRTDVLTYFPYVGYEDNGNTLLFVWENSAALHKYDAMGPIKQDWIFIGEKKKDFLIEKIINDAVMKMPYWLTLPQKDGMVFGAQAFHAWADDVELGRFDTENDLWGNYAVYISNMSSNAGVPKILDYFVELNPQYKDLHDEISKKYLLLGDREDNYIWKNLEYMGAGLGVTTKVLKDFQTRKKVVFELRRAADCLDDILSILNKIPKD